MAKKTFDEVLLEAVDVALDSLGQSAKKSIYFQLERKFEIERDEIPGRIKDFAEGLEKIFGVGAHFLEILIMKELYKRVGHLPEWDENKKFLFAEYVAAARHSFS